MQPIGPIPKLPEQTPIPDATSIHDLPKEILELILKSDAEVIQVAPHVNKQWHKIVTTSDLSIKVLCACQHPLSIQGAFKDALKKLAEVVSKKGLSSIGDILSKSYSPIVAVSHGKIALAEKVAENILVYDSSEDRSIKIDTPLRTFGPEEEKSAENRSCLSLVFAGNRVCASYFSFGVPNADGKYDSVTPYKIFVSDLDTLSNHEISLMYRPCYLQANEKQIVAFFEFDPSNRKRVSRVLKSWDPNTLKEKFTLNETTHPILQSKQHRFLDDSIDVLALNGENLYICNEGLYQIFNLEGKLIKELKRPDGSPWNVTRAIAFQDNVMAIGVRVPTQDPQKPAYAVELWQLHHNVPAKAYVKLHTFPASAYVQKLDLSLGERIQLTVGLDNDTAEVWNPEVEFRDRLAALEEERKKSAEVSSSGIFSKVWGATKNYFWGSSKK